MKYCALCLLPDSRPNLRLDAQGVCNACNAHKTKKAIPWDQREKAFREVVKLAKSKGRSYDCAIPVSGGKDSTWQVLKCLEYGLKPLAITWKTPGRTDLGAQNLKNLVGLGVDHIEFQVNPKVESKFMLQTYLKKGDTGIPMHMALFNIPRLLALQMEIPLIIWGENSAFEYGGSKEEQEGFVMDGAWIKKFGVIHGTEARDWVSAEVTERDLAPYLGPKDSDLQREKVLSVFLGYYFQWDPEITLKAALSQGFQVRKEGPKTGYYNYADIDDDFISIHHYLKWYKFGFTRLFDNLALEIRNGRLTRDEGIKIIRKLGEQRPDEDIARVCRFMGITEKRFFEIAETFRNHTIWTNKTGKWVIENFLIPDFPWRAT